MNRRKIYPDCVRTNVLTSNHSRIAMKHYCSAKKEFELIKEKQYSFDTYENFNSMSEHIDVVCVFSAMAIEAFFNDYAAACLGDSEFYDNFDKLSTISKFQLIAKFILKVKLDKNKSYYSNLKALIKERDSLVHGKSKSFVFDSEKDITSEWDTDTSEFPHINYQAVGADFKRAQNAIKALRDIALLFDSIDCNASAKFRLLSYSNIIELNEDYINLIVKEFNVLSDTI